METTINKQLGFDLATVKTADCPGNPQTDRPRDHPGRGGGGAGSHYHRSHAGFQLWVQYAVAVHSHFHHEHYLYAYLLQAGHAYRDASAPRHPALLWQRSGGLCRHLPVLFLPVFHFWEHFRQRRRHEPAFRHQLEDRIPDHDCHPAGHVFCQEYLSKVERESCCASWP
mgnify:CR=1 FL=1